MGSLGEIVKNMGSLGEGDAKNRALNSLTYVSPLEWECPSPGICVTEVGQLSPGPLAIMRPAFLVHSKSRAGEGKT